MTAHDCKPPAWPTEDDPREWLCPDCKTVWDRVEHSEDEGEIYETWYERRGDPLCQRCERCTWNPGPDCGRQDHPHCLTCGHCGGRHEGEALEGATP